MRLRRVKAAIGSVLAAVTLLSMSLTGVTAAQASDDNLALNQTVTASSYEVATTAPEKAVAVVLRPSARNRARWRDYFTVKRNQPGKPSLFAGNAERLAHADDLVCCERT